MRRLSPSPVSLQVKLFYFPSFSSPFFSVFGFLQCEYDMPRYRPFGTYLPLWVSSELIDFFLFVTYHQFCKILSHYQLKYFFCCISSFFQFWYFHCMYVLLFETVPSNQMSCSVLFILFSIFISVQDISIDLASSH